MINRSYGQRGSSTDFTCKRQPSSKIPANVGLRCFCTPTCICLPSPRPPRSTTLCCRSKRSRRKIPPGKPAKRPCIWYLSPHPASTFGGGGGTAQHTRGGKVKTSVVAKIGSQHDSAVCISANLPVTSYEERARLPCVTQHDTHMVDTTPEEYHRVIDFRTYRV